MLGAHVRVCATCMDLTTQLPVYGHICHKPVNFGEKVGLVVAAVWSAHTGYIRPKLQAREPVLPSGKALGW